MHKLCGWMVAAALAGVSAPAWGMTLEQAQHDPRLQVSITSSAYTTVTIRIQNKSTELLSVSDAPGTVLGNDDASEQDLTVSDTFEITVAPGKVTTMTIGAYCLEEDRGVPAQAVFTAHGFYKHVAELIEPRRGRIADNSVQDRIWALHLNRRGSRAPRED